MIAANAEDAMANQGFGNAGFGSDHFGSDDFAALSRQYWSRWGELLRAAGGATPQAATGFGTDNPLGAAWGMPGAASMPGWNEAAAWWSQFAGGASPTADEAMRRFGTQAQGWFGQMQQLAARFGGQDASARDIAAAWQRMVAGQGGNPFADALRGMQGPGQQGFEQWYAQVSPWLEQLAGEGRSWLGLPAFGFTREHQQRWQQLARAQLDYQQQARSYHELMTEAGQEAFRRFEDKLVERSAPGKQLGSVRALFDLWIDAAEEAYADVALSPRFRDAYGAMTDAQMRLRAAVQREVEQLTDALGIPTRTEVDAAHRKVAQLERELRRMRERADSPAAPSAARATRNPTTRADSKPDAKAAPVKKGGNPKAAESKPKTSKAPASNTAKTAKTVTSTAARRGKAR